MRTDDLPRLETRYATLRMGPKTAAIIKLETSSRTGDGPWIGSYRIVQRISSDDFPLAEAKSLAEMYAAREHME